MQKERFDELLGSEGEEYDEPDEIVPALLFKAALRLSWALEAWSDPENSAEAAYNVLSGNYSLAAQLDHTAAERARQLADIEAVRGRSEPMTRDELASLERASREVKDLMRTRFKQVVDVSSR